MWVRLDLFDAHVVKGGVLNDGLALGQQFVLLSLVPPAHLFQNRRIDLNHWQSIEFILVLLHLLALKDLVDKLDLVVGGLLQIGYHRGADHPDFLTPDRPCILSQSNHHIDGALLGGILSQYLLKLLLIFIFFVRDRRGNDLVDGLEVLHELVLGLVEGRMRRRGGGWLG